jgi:hypothetical protein
MALGSTQPLVKMSARNISWGIGDRCVRLTTSPLSLAECHEIWVPKPSGTLWATPVLLRDCFTLYICTLYGQVFGFVLKNILHGTYIKTIYIFLYGCETWSLAVKEEYMLWFSDSRELRKIFGEKREGVKKEGVGDCKEVHEGNIPEGRCTPNIIRTFKSSRLGWMARVTWHVARG